MIFFSISVWYLGGLVWFGLVKNAFAHNFWYRLPILKISTDLDSMWPGLPFLMVWVNFGLVWFGLVKNGFAHNFWYKQRFRKISTARNSVQQWLPCPMSHVPAVWFGAVFTSFLNGCTHFWGGWSFGMMHMTSTDPPQLVLGGVVQK